jgi:hypothetical protein
LQVVDPVDDLADAAGEVVYALAQLVIAGQRGSLVCKPAASVL